MKDWAGARVSFVVAYALLGILENLTVLLALLLTRTRLAPQLRHAQERFRHRRGSLCAGSPDTVVTPNSKKQTEQCPADRSDLGRRYLDFVAQGLGQGMAAAAVGRSSFIDISAYSEVILTTEWEADGLLACCVLFAVFTAETRRASACDGQLRTYPVRTVIVEEGRTDVKAGKAREALSLMQQMGIIPSKCKVGVYEGFSSAADAGQTRAPECTRTPPAGRFAGVASDKEALLTEESGREGKDGGASRKSPASFVRALGRRVCGLLLWRSTTRRKNGLGRIRELLTMNRRRERRVLIVAMSPPKDLARVLLEPKWGWWWWGHGGQAFDHVDLLVSRGVGGVSQAGTGDVGGHHSVEKALSKLRRVFVVQLDDLVRSYGFPKAVTPDRTPNLSAAIAGAGGLLPSQLRQHVAASNHALLAMFPDRLASAISAGRYSDEELLCRALAIAAAVCEEPQAGRAKLAELGASMADLIASDFEALDAAGLSPGTQQAVFRSMDVGMSLNEVAVAWALARQDCVSWQHYRHLTACSSCGQGRIVPSSSKNCEAFDDGRSDSGEFKGERTVSGGWELIHHERVCSGAGGGKGVCSGVEGGLYCNGDVCIGVCGECGGRQGKGEVGKGARVGRDGGLNRAGFEGFLATGFADGAGERLEDQEAGYKDFATFLVRVLDQMP